MFLDYHTGSWYYKHHNNRLSSIILKAMLEMKKLEMICFGIFPKVMTGDPLWKKEVRYSIFHKQGTLTKPFPSINWYLDPILLTLLCCQNKGVFFLLLINNNKLLQQIKLKWYFFKSIITSRTKDVDNIQHISVDTKTNE